MSITYHRWTAPIAEAATDLLPLCHAVFERFDDDSLITRLATMTDPMLWIAEDAEGWVGFKLAYRRSATTLYSWLGGVHPRVRNQGVASALMVRQHEAALADGYTHVETRTQPSNTAMIIANLRHGLQVCGYDTNANGLPMITLRRAL